MAFLDIENLFVKYGKVEAVKGLNLKIDSGHVFGFIGPNGAGKTSTIKVLATLLQPDYGKVKLDDIDLLKNPYKIRRMIGYMPDFFGIYADLTVKEYLHFYAAAYSINYKTRKKVVEEVLELTDMSGKTNEQVDSLSRGMKQRLGVGRVLLHDPKLLLLDEPASGLDPRARIEMRELLKELTNMGKTIIISSHILSELAELATCIGIIEAGNLIAEGSLDEIYRQLKLSRTIHMMISNIDQTMLEAIRKLDGVLEVTEEIDRIAVALDEQKLTVEILHSKIYELGAQIYMFQPEAMDMETVFMKLTKGKVA